MSADPFFIARTDDLVVEELGDELVIFDRRSDVAHCLSTIAMVVWQACDGGASFDEVVYRVAANHFPAPAGVEDIEALVAAAAAELKEKGLLESRGPEAAAISRRHALRRMAGVGAAAVAAPLVVSAAVPATAAAHGSQPTCIASGGTCNNAMTPNSGNNCCTATSDYCSATNVCTTCVASGTNIGCSSSNKYMCCNNACNGASGKCA